MKIHYCISTSLDQTEVFIIREIKALIEQGEDVYVTQMVPNLGNSELLDLPEGRLTAPSPSSFRRVKSSIRAIFNGTSIFYKRNHWRFMVHLLGQKPLIKILGSGILIDHFNEILGDTRGHHFHSHHLFLTSYVAYQIADRKNTHFSLTLHTLTHLYPKRLLKTLLSKATFLRTISTELKPYFNLFISNDEKFRLITNGVNLDESHLRPHQKSEAKLQIVAVGSLYDKKGFDVLIESCLLLKHYQIDFRCIIIGDGPEMPFLRRLVSTRGLSEFVSLPGAQSNQVVLQTIRESDVLVSPNKEPKRSTRDGLPTVIIEAMALSVPVIATDFAGIPDIVKHKETGYLIPPEDYKALASAIVELSFNKSLKHDMVRKAHALVKTKYNLNKTVVALQELFQEVEERLN